MSQDEQTSEQSPGGSVSGLYLPGYDLEATDDLNFRYGFKLGDLGFLLPEAAQSEVVASPNIYSIPNTVHWMKGLISVRGNFASVFDLGGMFALNLSGRQESVVVLQIDSDLIAFPLDSAHSLELPSAVTEGAPNLHETLRLFAGDVYKTDQGFWFEFDFKACVSRFATQIHQ